MRTLTKAEKKQHIRRAAFVLGMILSLGGIIFDDSIGALHHIFILMGGIILGATITHDNN